MKGVIQLTDEWPPTARETLDEWVRTPMIIFVGDPGDLPRRRPDHTNGTDRLSRYETER